MSAKQAIVRQIRHKVRERKKAHAVCRLSTLLLKPRNDNTQSHTYIHTYMQKKPLHTQSTVSIN